LAIIGAGLIYGKWRLRQTSWRPLFEVIETDRERHRRQVLVSLVALVAAFVIPAAAFADSLYSPGQARVAAAAFCAVMSGLTFMFGVAFGDNRVKAVASGSLVVILFVFIAGISSRMAQTIVLGTLATGLAVVGFALILRSQWGSSI
jgi:hypothetical protein